MNLLLLCAKKRKLWNVSLFKHAHRLTSWWSQTLTLPASELPAEWRWLRQPPGQTYAPVRRLSACFCRRSLSGSPVTKRNMGKTNELEVEPKTPNFALRKTSKWMHLVFITSYYASPDESKWCWGWGSPVWRGTSRRILIIKLLIFNFNQNYSLI